MMKIVFSFLSVLLLGLGSAQAPTPGYQYTIYCIFSFNSVNKIDGVEQVFQSDFYLSYLWTDPAWTTNDTAVDYDESKYFNPRLEFVNSQEVDERVDNPYFWVEEKPAWLLALDPDPSHIYVRADQRYIGTFNTPLQLQDFPYDIQVVRLDLESFYDSNTLKIRFAEPDKVDDILPPDLSIIGWDIKGRSQQSRLNYYPAFNTTYSQLTVEVKVERQPEFFLYKIVAGSILLVYMCVYIFALAVDEPDRMMGTLSVFAGLITFLFVATQDVPKVAYQTRIDVFMSWSFFLVALMLFTHGTLYYFREDEDEDNKREEEAEKANVGAIKRWWMSLVPTRKADIICMLFYSLVYTIGIAIILGRPVDDGNSSTGL